MRLSAQRYVIDCHHTSIQFQMHSSGSQVRINSGLFFHGWKGLDFTLMIFLHLAHLPIASMQLYLTYLHQAFPCMPGSNITPSVTTVVPYFCMFLLYSGSSALEPLGVQVLHVVSGSLQSQLLFFPMYMTFWWHQLHLTFLSPFLY